MSITTARQRRRALIYGTQILAGKDLWRAAPGWESMSMGSW